MSAFIVHKATIDAIVTAWINLGGHYSRPHERRPKATEIGRMLWAENYRSVAYRYPGDGDDLPGPYPSPDVEAYEYEPVPWESGIDLVGKLARLGQLLACYEYQSCEHEGWTESKACAFIGRLRSEALARLYPDDDARYWGIKDDQRDVFVTAPRKVRKVQG